MLIPKDLNLGQIKQHFNIGGVNFGAKTDIIVEKDYRKYFLELIEQNSELLLPKVLLVENEHFTIFHFKLNDRWVIMSKVFEGAISLTNINMPGDGIRAMLFAINHAVISNAKLLNLEAFPQDNCRTLDELKGFYNLFGFIVIEGNSMCLELNNENMKQLCIFIEEYLGKNKK